MSEFHINGARVKIGRINVQTGEVEIIADLTEEEKQARYSNFVWSSELTPLADEWHPVIIDKDADNE